MRYAQILPFDVCNGEGIGVSLFTQGCPFHCENCFNPETWDFNGGKEWTKEIEIKFLNLISKPYIKRVTILGGEPLINNNLEDLFRILKTIKSLYPDKNIWLYTGHCIDQIVKEKNGLIYNILFLCDVVVDGRYIDKLKDFSLKFRGSSNQRLIDMKKTLESNEIVLYEC